MDQRRSALRIYSKLTVIEIEDITFKLKETPNGFRTAWAQYSHKWKTLHQILGASLLAKLTKKGKDHQVSVNFQNYDTQKEHISCHRL